MELKETFQKVKTASKTLSLLSDDQRNEILQAVADAIIAETPALLAANIWSFFARVEYRATSESVSVQRMMPMVGLSSGPFFILSYI